MTEDITYCYNEKCKNKKCKRHVSHIKKYYIPHSFAYFKDCAYWDMSEKYTSANCKEEVENDRQPESNLPQDR